METTEYGNLDSADISVYHPLYLLGPFLLFGTLEYFNGKYRWCFIWSITMHQKVRLFQIYICTWKERSSKKINSKKDNAKMVTRIKTFLNPRYRYWFVLWTVLEYTFCNIWNLFYYITKSPNPLLIKDYGGLVCRSHPTIIWWKLWFSSFRKKVGEKWGEKPIPNVISRATGHSCWRGTYNSKHFCKNFWSQSVQ